MKKILTLLSLTAFLSLSSPAFAAPPPPPPGHGGPHQIHAGYRHNMRRHPHHGYYKTHGRISIYTNFSNYGSYGYRYGNYPPFYPCPPCMSYGPFYGNGFYLSF